MKKIIRSIIAILVVLAAWLSVSAIEQTYTREGYVLDKINDSYIIVDYEINNEWAYQEECDLKEGDEVILHMVTNGTDSIYDDVITRVERK